jgi:hypothetical protein
MALKADQPLLICLVKRPPQPGEKISDAYDVNAAQPLVARHRQQILVTRDNVVRPTCEGTSQQFVVLRVATADGQVLECER